MTDQETPDIAAYVFKKFEQKCNQLIKSGYEEMIREKDNMSNWGEEKITCNLYQHMNELVETAEYPYIDVAFESNDVSKVTNERTRVDFKVKNPLEYVTYIPILKLSSSLRVIITSGNIEETAS